MDFEITEFKDRNEIVTIEGLEKLSASHIQDRPKNWRELVVHYIDTKRAYIREHRSDKYNRAYLSRAIKLASKMGVDVNTKTTATKS